MKTISILSIPWREQSKEPAPIDVPIIALSPSGNVQIHYGRNMLGWTRWLTVDEFAKCAKELVSE
jgi:hypothetical protein